MTDAKPGQPRKKSIHLKRAGSIILAVLAFSPPEFIYWLGTRNNDFSSDPSMQGFNRAEQRQMGQLYGSSGEMIEDWTDDLKQPGTQAVLILIVSGSGRSRGCFYFCAPSSLLMKVPIASKHRAVRCILQNLHAECHLGPRSAWKNLNKTRFPALA